MTMRKPAPANVPRCPVCGKHAAPAARPFCSVRCANIDLGRWLTEQYRLPGPPPELDDDPPPTPPDAA